MSIFIFGRTTWGSALDEAKKLFVWSKRALPQHHKLLFVLCDGKPICELEFQTDREWIRIGHLHKDTIVGCYISTYSNFKELEDTFDTYCGISKKDLEEYGFSLSLDIPAELKRRAVNIMHGWKIEIISNENILYFLEVCNSDKLKDACEAAKNAVCFYDAVVDIFASVRLDAYINGKNTSIKAHEQIGGTCYANASAAVLYLAMHRILGREDGYPEFEQLRDDIISRHGNDGAPTFQVLKEICPLYRLQCRHVDENKALKAVTAKRPVVAIFRLTGDEWSCFSKFYRSNPTGILTKCDLDITKRNLKPETKTTGHAVVLTSFDRTCLLFLNSWGDKWADRGFFRTESADVLGMEFIDVFYTLANLTKTEKEYYTRYGLEVGRQWKRSLESMAIATLTCPLCDATSKITEFTGTVSYVVCPICHGKFPCIDRKFQNWKRVKSFTEKVIRKLVLAWKNEPNVKKHVESDIKSVLVNLVCHLKRNNLELLPA